MQHLGTKSIETERLLLRPFIPEDARAMYDNWASDPAVTKYLTWPVHGSVEVTRAVLARWVADYDRPDFYQWAIVPKDLGAPIGSLSVVSCDEEVEKAEVGYCIGSRWWHQGLTSEALGAVLDFLFDEVGLQRVEARHDPRNPHSGGVMRKCGMQYEGTRCRSDRNQQGLCDESWYAILNTDREG
ncbi:MAG: GNAT family N-acetyltransferase [Oscillospiraceae bacterium]|nr:GNAT family N-acetyltransferase [Oscillospiraceae bacterium]